MEVEALVGGGGGGAPSLQLGSYALQLMRQERRGKILEPVFQQNEDANKENYSEEIFSSAPSLLHFIQTAAVASGSGKTKQFAVLVTQQLSRLFHYALVQQDQSISASLLPQEQTPLEVLLAAIQHHRQNHCFVRSLFVDSLFRDAAAASQIPAQALWLLHKAQVLPFHHFLGMLLPHWTNNPNHQEKGLPDVARLISELQEGLLLFAMPSSATSSNNRRKQLAIEELLKLAIRIATYDAAAISTVTTTSATSSTTVAASATTSTAAATTGSGRTVLYSAEEVFSASHLLAAIVDEANQHRAHKRRVCLLRLAKDIPAHHITQSFFVQQLNSLILVPSLDASSLDFSSDTAPVSIEEAFISFETTKTQTKEHSTIVFQELVSFFSLNFLLSRVSQLVEDPTIANWPQAITYLQVLRSSSTQASQVLLSFFREELTSSITSMNSYKCRVLILLFRTLAPPHTEERSPTTSFMSYFAWLRDTITNVSRSRKSSVFLLNLLNDLFDLENAYYLRLHLQLVPRLRKASTLAEEYVNKAKTKLSTMGESTQQSSFQASSLFYQQQSSEKVEQEVQSLIAKFGLEALPSSSLASDFMVYTQQQGDKGNQTSPNNAGYVNLISYLHQVSLLKPRWFQQVLLPHLVSPPAVPLSQLSTGRQHLLLALLQASSSDFQQQQQQRTTSNKTSVRGRGKSPTLSIGGSSSRSGGAHQNQGGALLLSSTLRSKLVDYLLACQRLLPQQTAPSSSSLLHEASASASARPQPQLIILEED